LLPRVGDRFLSPEVRDQEGHCIGPALIHTSRERVIGLENGWQRRFKLVASLEYQGSAIVVHEQVMAEDFDPRDPGRPPLPFRTSDSDRVIFLTARGGMRSVGTPLFERATRAQGSIQLPLDEAEGGRRRAAPQRPRE
ncbi:MAG: hypothetical protein K8H88_09075, partial [Sandaracinaceae bacterium]|nr:hypothetical protein [Sandaracinaceae bacterium]